MKLTRELHAAIEEVLDDIDDANVDKKATILGEIASKYTDQDVSVETIGVLLEGALLTVKAGTKLQGDNVPMRAATMGVWIYFTTLSDEGRERACEQLERTIAEWAGEVQKEQAGLINCLASHPMPAPSGFPPVAAEIPEECLSNASRLNYTMRSYQALLGEYSKYCGGG